MQKNKLLPKGTKLYLLEESMTDRWFSDDPYHFEIVTGEITNCIKGGFVEYRIRTINRLGHDAGLRYIRAASVGVSAFTDFESAVEYAERRTNYHERKYGYGMKEPMMRPWRENSDSGREETAESQTAPVQETDSRQHEPGLHPGTDLEHGRSDPGRAMVL